MKSLMLLWQQVLKELGTRIGVSTAKSNNYALRRFDNEGLEFLTLALPEFCADFETSLREGGHFVPSQMDKPFFPGFCKTRSGSKNPAFLSEFMDRVIDPETGVVLEEPCIESIFAIRQLTLMMAKIGLDCTDVRIEAAIERYLECEKEVRECDRLMDPDLLQDFESMCIRLYGDVLTKMDSDVYNGRIVPKHGPGSTADRLQGNAKYDQAEWPLRLERIFPYGEYALPNWRYYYRLDHVDFLEPGRERPVRVITVPKTQKTPRIIAIEPTAMQYMQQALSRNLVDYLETDETVGGMIGFLDQIPNQEMAQRGSYFEDLATLDLSEASDRVSYQHVRSMLAKYPHFREGVDACRSRKADVRGTVIRLSKFASMGSALCFPMEAMTFLAIVFMGIQKANNTRLSRKDIKSYHGRVRVYGDDIIIPVEFASAVVEMLNAFGHRVNSSKSFWTGLFRESCGKEYYNGFDVSIVRVRSVFPTRRSDVSEIVSTVALRNNLYAAGLWTTAYWLDEVIEGILPHYPSIYPTSPLLGRHSFLGYNPERMDEHLHVPLVKGYVVSSSSPASPVSGEGALLKCLLPGRSNPFEDVRHLERQGRPETARLKLRWAKPF